MVNVSEHANKVADAIEAHGHYQGSTFESPVNTGCCIVVNTANTSLSESYPFYRALAEHLGLTPDPESSVGYALTDIYEWNDNTSTDEVLATLRSL